MLDKNINNATTLYFEKKPTSKTITEDMDLQPIEHYYIYINTNGGKQYLNSFTPTPDPKLASTNKLTGLIVLIQMNVYSGNWEYVDKGLNTPGITGEKLKPFECQLLSQNCQQCLWGTKDNHDPKNEVWCGYPENASTCTNPIIIASSLNHYSAGLQWNSTNQLIYTDFTPDSYSIQQVGNRFPAWQISLAGPSPPGPGPGKKPPGPGPGKKPPGPPPPGPTPGPGPSPGPSGISSPAIAGIIIASIAGLGITILLVLYFLGKLG